MNFQNCQLFCLRNQRCRVLIHSPDEQRAYLYECIVRFSQWVVSAHRATKTYQPFQPLFAHLSSPSPGRVAAVFRKPGLSVQGLRRGFRTQGGKATGWVLGSPKSSWHGSIGSRKLFTDLQNGHVLWLKLDLPAAIGGPIR